MVLDDLPPELRPIVQPIDTWFEARRLGLVFEARVAGGKLLVCSMDLTRPGRAARRAADAPQPAAIRGRTRFRPAGGRPAGSAPQPDAATVQNGAARRNGHGGRPAAGLPRGTVLDGHPETIWHTAWGDRQQPPPHELTIDLGRPVAITGLAYLPRQDMSNGRVGEYAVHLSDDGRDWGPPVAEGTWPDRRTAGSPLRPPRRPLRAAGGPVGSAAARLDLGGGSRGPDGVGSMGSGLVFNIQRYCLHDGPGIRTTVFLKGCPLSCWWCHNPESQAGGAGGSRGRVALHPLRPVPARSVRSRRRGPESGRRRAVHALRRLRGGLPDRARQMVGRWMTVDEGAGRGAQDRIFYDDSGGGVTFSGGEPLMQPDFLRAAARPAAGQACTRPWTPAASLRRRTCSRSRPWSTCSCTT